MTIEEIREVKDMDSDKKEYASKSLAGTALGFGIGGAALGLWNTFKGHGRFGGGMPENININGVGGTMGLSSGRTCPTAYEVEVKECDDVLALTNGLWRQAYNQQNQRFEDRQTIDREMFGLYKSQTDADFGLYKNQRDGFDVLSNRISCLEKDVAIRPYQDKLIQCDIEKAYIAGINHTDRVTCRMITGELVLPNTPVVTGYGSYNSCRCNSASTVVSK